MINVKSLTKNYNEIRAVDDVSFEITHGECVGLLGLNGAGKTTLLRILACLLAPTSGQVTVDGIDATGASETVRRRIGFLPEESPLYGEMRVRQFLEFLARLRGVSGKEVAAKVSDVGKRCRVEEVFEQRIETLSYGYKKRVGIAQAVVHGPPLVILDEPIAGLDPAQIVEMRELVRGLRGEHTVMLSSHILNEISQTCDRILVMHRGQIVAAGTEEELAGGLSREQRLSVQLLGERGQVEQVLKGVKGITGWKVASDEDGRLVLEVRSSGDIRVELSRSLVEEGLGLLELSRQEDRLESIFLRLTGGGKEET